jgi:hypothetical protein
LNPPPRPRIEEPGTLELIAPHRLPDQGCLDKVNCTHMLRKETPRKAGCGGQVPVVEASGVVTNLHCRPANSATPQGPENKIRTHADNESGPQEPP